MVTEDSDKMFYQMENIEEDKIREEDKTYEGQ
jgi:hypothetical protein